MDLTRTVLVLLIVGMVVWGSDRWLPIPDKIRKVVNAVVVGLTILWLVVTAARYMA